MSQIATMSWFTEFCGMGYSCWMGLEESTSAQPTIIGMRVPPS